MGGSASWYPQGTRHPHDASNRSSTEVCDSAFPVLASAEVIVDLVPRLSLGIDDTATEQTEAHDEGVLETPTLAQLRGGSPMPEHWLKVWMPFRLLK